MAHRPLDRDDSDIFTYREVNMQTFERGTAEHSPEKQRWMRLHPRAEKCHLLTLFKMSKDTLKHSSL